jgi:protocatechuate 3,4-dioxygenase beta subunit
VAASSGTGSIATTVNLAPGASVTFTVVAQISRCATGNLVNTATVAAPSGVIDANLTNNTATDTDTTAKPGSIAGHKYQDLTGNGLTCDDRSMPLKNVEIDLYRDVNGNGVLDAADGSYVAKAITDCSGAYSFTSAMPGVYFVKEVVPSGYVRTAPLTSDYYTVAVASGAAITGVDFADFRKCCPCGITNITYWDNCTQVSGLNDNTHQGDVVRVTFTVTSTTVVSLVSYTAPSAVWDVNVANQQRVFDVDSHTFAPGTYTLCVRIPNSFYQIDFVCGTVIDTLGTPGSNIFYTAQGRLISADNGGVQSVCDQDPSIAGSVFVDSNLNGTFDSGETGLGLVSVTLTGIDNQNNAVSLSTLTKLDGSYLFDNLNPGTYTVTEGTVANYVHLGQIAGTTGGTAKQRTITTTLAANDNSANKPDCRELQQHRIERRPVLMVQQRYDRKRHSYNGRNDPIGECDNQVHRQR